MTRSTSEDICRISSEPQAIRRQLERVLESVYFRGSKQLSRFLQFVIEEHLAGRGIKLNQYAIAVSALDRDDDFDPETDAIVRIEARRLRHTLAQYYQHEGRHDPIRIEIPKGRYLPVFHRNISTRSEISAVGTRIQELHDDARSEGAQGPTIVLLSTVNLGRGSELDDIALALTEELASALSRFETIRLIGPLTSNGLQQARPEARDIAKEYRAHYMLSAGIHERNRRVRLLTRLLDANSGESTWSDKIEFPIDGNAGQRARDRVVKHLAATIGDLHGVATTHWVNRMLRIHSAVPKQHEVLVFFRYYLNALDRDSFGKTVLACERALQRWPDDALANAILAGMALTDYVRELAAMERPLQRAETLARHAVRVEPALQLTRFTMGKVLFYKRERGPSLAEFDRALKLNPYNAFTKAWIGMYLCFFGKWQHGTKLIRSALALTPDNPLYRAALALSHYHSRNYEAAWTEACRMDLPDLFWAPLMRAAVLGQLDRRLEARRELNELLRLFPAFRDKGRERMQVLLFSDDNVEMLMDGLRKAGLKDVS